MRVLIVKLSSIGDVIHTLPSLFALKEGYKRKDSDFEIDWIVEEAASSILKDNSLIDNLIIVKRRGWSRFLKENLKVVKRVRARRYDMVIDFQGLFKSALWVLLSKGKRRVGYSGGRELSSVPLNDKLPPYDAEKHAVERYLDLAIHAGGKVEKGIFFPIHISKKEQQSAEALVAESLKTRKCEKGYFVLVPRARWASKEWPDESFIEFAQKAIERYSLHAIIVGAEGDKNSLDNIAATIGANATNIAGRTDLKELAAIFGMADFTVTIDTGPMHLSAAMGTRTIALFGPTAPWRTGPYGRDHLVIRTGLECSPCYKRECEKPECLLDIKVDTVIEAIDRLKAGNRKNARD